MKKRTESSIVTSILRYLQVLENSGKIAWVDRLNSGRMVFKRGNKFQSIRMCRPGTPDIICLLKTGGVIWLEVKTDTGKQEIEQHHFESMISKLPMHHYFIVRNVDEVVKIIGDPNRP